MGVSGQRLKTGPIGADVRGIDEQLSTSQAQGLAETLGLAPSDHDHGFVASDDLLESIDGRRISSVSGKTYSRKSGRLDGSSKSRIPMAEVVVEAGISYPPLGLSSSSEAASNPRKPRHDQTTQEREDTPGALPVADDEAGYSTPARRPRRSAAKNKDYSAKWNADGSEIRQRTKKGQSVERGNSSRRSRAPTSSAKTAQSSGKGSRAMDAISIGSDEEAQEEEPGEMAPPGEALVAADAGDSTVADSGFDEDLPVEEAQRSTRGRTRATEEEESPLPRKRNKRAARALARRESTPQSDREDETLDRPAKRSRRGRKNSDDAVDDEAEEVTGRPEVRTVGEETQVGEEEDGQAEEACEKGAADLGQVARAAVLAEADAAVNAGRGKGRRGQEHEERIKDVGDSAASSSRASTSSSLLSVNKRFWGKREWMTRACVGSLLTIWLSRWQRSGQSSLVSPHALRAWPSARLCRCKRIEVSRRQSEPQSPSPRASSLRALTWTATKSGPGKMRLPSRECAA